MQLFLLVLPIPWDNIKTGQWRTLKGLFSVQMKSRVPLTLNQKLEKK